jgi:hypothetical protein
LPVHPSLGLRTTQSVDDDVKDIITEYISKYNLAKDEKKEYYYNKIISNCPMGLMLWCRITTNYLQLKTIYKQRKNHKLKEWRDFCKWIEKLEMFELITGVKI